jgi:hypothetical protein
MSADASNTAFVVVRTGSMLLLANYFVRSDELIGDPDGSVQFRSRRPMVVGSVNGRVWK